MIVAWIALFVALSGAGYAAVRSIPGRDGVIHSCYRKSNGALRVVTARARCHKGERRLSFNKTGKQGVPGPQGAQGPQGVQGPAGPLTTALPSGQTLRGWFNLDTVATSGNAGQFNGGTISFGSQLPAAPTVQILPVGGRPTAQCPGTVANPAAAPGYFCLYQSSQSNVSSFAVCGSASPPGCPTTTPTADPFGAEIFVHSTGGNNRFYTDGTWAVTAP